MQEIYVVDIDGVLTMQPSVTDFTYEGFMKILPNFDVIDKVNKLFLDGHTIILHTSRLWADFKVTTEWLQKYKVEYDTLVMGKPLGTKYLDDKNILLEEFTNE